MLWLTTTTAESVSDSSKKMTVMEVRSGGVKVDVEGFLILPRLLYFQSG